MTSSFSFLFIFIFALCPLFIIISSSFFLLLELGLKNTSNKESRLGINDLAYFLFFSFFYSFSYSIYSVFFFFPFSVFSISTFSSLFITISLSFLSWSCLKKLPPYKAGGRALLGSEAQVEGSCLGGDKGTHSAPHS